MAKKNFNDVFAAHPKVDKLYIVKGMPFTDEVNANNYARGERAGKPEIVNRPEKVEATPPASKYASLNKMDLIAELKTREGLEFDPKATNAVMVELLEANDKAAAEKE